MVFGSLISEVQEVNMSGDPLVECTKAKRKILPRSLVLRAYRLQVLQQDATPNDTFQILREHDGTYCRK
jgi:hypothetical protein